MRVTTLVPLFTPTFAEVAQIKEINSLNGICVFIPSCRTQIQSFEELLVACLSWLVSTCHWYQSFDWYRRRREAVNFGWGLSVDPGEGPVQFHWELFHKNLTFFRKISTECASNRMSLPCPYQNYFLHCTLHSRSSSQSSTLNLGWWQLDSPFKRQKGKSVHKVHGEWSFGIKFHRLFRIFCVVLQ